MRRYIPFVVFTLFSLVSGHELVYSNSISGSECASAVVCLGERNFTFCFVVDGNVVLQNDSYVCPSGYKCVADDFEPCVKVQVTSTTESLITTPSSELFTTESSTTESEPFTSTTTPTPEPSSTSTTTPTSTTTTTTPTTESSTTESSTSSTTTTPTTTTVSSTTTISTTPTTTAPSTTTTITTALPTTTTTALPTTTTTALPTTTRAPATPPPNCDNGKGKYPAPQCIQYYECVQVLWWYELRTQTCPVNQAFDQNTLTCLPLNQTNCAG